MEALKMFQKKKVLTIKINTMANQSSSSSVSVMGLLGVLFVGLKLCKVIDWSWWWVTLPFWIGIPLILIAFLIVIILKALK